MRKLARILVPLVLLGLAGMLGWNAWRVRQILSAWKVVGVAPVRNLDLGRTEPSGKEVRVGSHVLRLPWARPEPSGEGGVEDADTRKALSIRPVPPGGPRIAEIQEVLEFDPAGLSCWSSWTRIGRAHELAKKRVGEFGGARISVFDYRGFRGLKSESGQEARYRVFGSDGQEFLSVGIQTGDPSSGESDGILRSLLDGLATSSR